MQLCSGCRRAQLGQQDVARVGGRHAEVVRLDRLAERDRQEGTEWTDIANAVERVIVTNTEFNGVADGDITSCGWCLRVERRGRRAGGGDAGHRQTNDNETSV